MLAALAVLLLMQPLLVSANSATRARDQLAGIAQLEETEESAEEPAEEASSEEDEDGTDGDGLTATAVAEEEITPSANQLNIELPTAASTDTFTAEIPLDETPLDEPTATPVARALATAISFAWQGEATINAQELGRVAPPLQAEVLQGDFQISYVAAAADSDTGDSLRILPVTAPGALRLALKLDMNSAFGPFPAGETVQLQMAARVYAPEGAARLLIADDFGSSSVNVEGLNWADYQVTRQIDARVTSVELLVEWSNVPANGWLEVRDLALARVTAAAEISPTDTPALVEAVTITPTVPPPTSTPTPVSLATATALPTATPVPASIAQATKEPADIAGTPVGTQVAPEPAAIGGTEAVTETVVLTPTPALLIVTATPTPVDIFEEATRVAQATEWARILGPATATPPNLAIATATPTPVVIVLVNTPTPGNQATATQAALLATAVAFTTGTPTPYPPEATIAIATPTAPRPTPTSRPTATATPIFVLLENLPVNEPAPTPLVPGELYGKIVFLTDFRGDPRRPNAMIMNPDGTGVGLLTTNTFYNMAASRDNYSPDSRYRAYNLREAGGEAHNAGLVQLFYDDYFYNSTQHQLTYFGAGVAWAPAWSPRGETIAFVSSETGNDEIWVMERGGWPARQLTDNEWEWDHHPSFSPDGSEIVFDSNRVTGNQQIWIMGSGGENQRQITNFSTFEAWDPVWVKYVEGQ